MKSAKPTGGSGESEHDVPADLALLLVDVDGRRCALQLCDVLEVQAMVRVNPLPQAPPAVEGVIDLRGDVVPVLDLRRRFGLESRPAQLDDRLVIVRASERVVALHVDTVVDVHHLSADDARPAPDEVVDQAIGIARLSDGLVVINDIDRFLSAEEEAVLATALERLRS